MKLRLLLLTPFLGLVASSRSNYAEFGSAKNMFYELGIADAKTYKLVDRLAELAGVPFEPDVTTYNNTDKDYDNEPDHHAIPTGYIKCRPKIQLDYMAVMTAVARLGEQCVGKKMLKHDMLWAIDDNNTLRAFACNFAKKNDCRLSQILEAVAEIWNHCKTGTPAGWWMSYWWKKGYGIERYDMMWCLFD
ncbi:hypothetical protein GGR51DRAFT_561621 [Nemania sp. FL0031]|nr:hypothetical protein GGR51DRAFT_561621 [Nemania sp. FL0031]